MAEFKPVTDEQVEGDRKAIVALIDRFDPAVSVAPILIRPCGSDGNQVAVLMLGTGHIGFALWWEYLDRSGISQGDAIVGISLARRTTIAHSLSYDQVVARILEIIVIAREHDPQESGMTAMMNRAGGYASGNEPIPQ